MIIKHPVILFDGYCNLCNSMVNFVIKQDKKGVFRFAPLQSKTGRELSAQFHLPEKLFNSFILIDKNKAYQKSVAALKVGSYLPWYWKWSQIFWIIPKFFRDAIYNIIANNRYKWFGKKDQCRLPTPEEKNKFLD